jgi:hypothetical protein
MLVSYPDLVTRTKTSRQCLWVEASNEDAARKRAAEFIDKVHSDDAYYDYPETTIEVLSQEQAKAEGFHDDRQYGK